MLKTASILTSCSGGPQSKFNPSHRSLERRNADTIHNTREEVLSKCQIEYSDARRLEYEGIGPAEEVGEDLSGSLVNRSNP